MTYNQTKHVLWIELQDSINDFMLLEILKANEIEFNLKTYKMLTEGNKTIARNFKGEDFRELKTR